MNKQLKVGKIYRRAHPACYLKSTQIKQNEFIFVVSAISEVIYWEYTVLTGKGILIKDITLNEAYWEEVNGS